MAKDDTVWVIHVDFTLKALVKPHIKKKGMNIKGYVEKLIREDLQKAS